MPWNNPNNFAFAERDIRGNAPAASGVYRIHNNEKEIFIWATDNIQKSLLGHVYGDVPCILEARPIWFSFEPAPAESAIRLRDEYIADLHPVCN